MAFYISDWRSKSWRCWSWLAAVAWGRADPLFTSPAKTLRLILFTYTILKRIVKETREYFPAYPRPERSCKNQNPRDYRIIKYKKRERFSAKYSFAHYTSQFSAWNDFTSSSAKIRTPSRLVSRNRINPRAQSDMPIPRHPSHPARTVQEGSSRVYASFAPSVRAFSILLMMMLFPFCSHSISYAKQQQTKNTRKS